MPFTLAHPAMILPLSKSKRFSLTALIAGSMVPDFEFFFQMREVENIGHHWYGILLFDLPVALLFCYIFHNILRNKLLLQLPNWYLNRFIPVLNFNWNQFAAQNRWRVILSVMIGITSHVFLDGFTHHDGVFVLMIPGLSENIPFMNHAVQFYFILQLLFSVIGLWLLHSMIAKLPVQKLNDSNCSKIKYYWPSILMICLLLVSARLLFWPAFNSFWGIFMAVMGGICYAWLLVSILLLIKIQKFQ